MNNKDYELINLEVEYPGIQGGCRWAVATDLSYDELFQKYGEELAMYKPLLLISTEQAEVFKEYNRNEEKHKKRATRCHDPRGYIEGQEMYQAANQVLHEITAYADNEDRFSAFMVRLALDNLSQKQQRRFRLFFFYGFTEDEIARIEGVAQPSIHESIQDGLNKLRYMLRI